MNNRTFEHSNIRIIEQQNNRIIEVIKKLKIKNLYQIDDCGPEDGERFEAIVRTEGLLIERIVSTGQATPDGEWYDQERDEWVVLLAGQAVLRFGDGSTTQLNPGDHLLIPARCRHRVESTTVDPPCVWLAVHGNLSENKPTTGSVNDK